MQNQFFFDNSISYVEQETDFQLGSILPVKSCKVASHSYASRAKHCTVLHLEFYFTIIYTNPVYFNTSNV